MKPRIRPVRTRYVHLKCGGVTEIEWPVGDIYARMPNFYTRHWCACCEDRFLAVDPDSGEKQFRWEDGSFVGD